ncbi:hypothetical protein BDN72DRAFT_859854 [Pluteus cervinus]|uniref:Uncharacterized protein n=1 Tax=Pluteus cervinus TaxID=181527 RepID=A0ACD3ALB0_9AGAR|nr:hypothetical protein BDN72DRAFT_859854 [Pluteus cervinus]
MWVLKCFAASCACPLSCLFFWAIIDDPKSIPDTLVIYSWLLQCNEEQELIYLGPWTCIKILYLICRWYPIVFGPVLLWAWVSEEIDRNTCSKVIVALYAATIPLQIFPQAIFVWRAVAFSQIQKKNRGILVLLTIVYLAYAFTGTAFMQLSIHLATASPVIETEGWLRLGQHCIKEKTTGGTLGKVFIIEGSLVFVGMSVNNIMAAVLYLRPHELFSGYMLPVILLTSNVLACSLILSLRRQAAPTDDILEQEHSLMVDRACAGLEDGS